MYVYIYIYLHILLYTVMPKFQDLILQGLVLDRFVHVAPRLPTPLRRLLNGMVADVGYFLGVWAANSQKVKLFSDVTLVYKAMNYPLVNKHRPWK